MRITPESKLRNTFVVTTAVIAGLLINGCGESRQSTPANKLPAAPRKSPDLPPTDTDNPRLNSLNVFRKTILTRHRARVAMGMCVAWPNSDGLLTVTYNPGVARLNVSQSEGNGKKEPTYIFAAPDGLTSSGQIEMDGPPVDSNLVFPTVMPMSIPGQPPEVTGVRLLSEGLVRDSNGQAYYTDTETGLPVMNTALVFSSIDGQPDPQIAINACIALRDHQPVPGIVEP